MFNKLLLAISTKIVTLNYTFNTDRQRKNIFSLGALYYLQNLGLSVSICTSINTTVDLGCVRLLQFACLKDDNADNVKQGQVVHGHTHAW